ncbi:hypothetical protein MUBE_02825 [Mycobacterium uberis]|uniref:Uncharacterized protein n=1 Tax=Mycobacterium uberis TaxID=2162698 RepID=A0A3E1HJW5_9MYCO|nr:hypothetical protein MUBE_02825 [Mycobacterium uberis]
MKKPVTIVHSAYHEFAESMRTDAICPPRSVSDKVSRRAALACVRSRSSFSLGAEDAANQQR